MPGHTILELAHRTTPGAPLSELIYWHAELSDAQRWTLVQQLRDLLQKHPQGRFIRTEASQDNEDRARARAL